MTRRYALTLLCLGPCDIRLFFAATRLPSLRPILLRVQNRNNHLDQCRCPIPIQTSKLDRVGLSNLVLNRSHLVLQVASSFSYCSGRGGSYYERVVAAAKRCGRKPSQDASANLQSVSDLSPWGAYCNGQRQRYWPSGQSRISKVCKARHKP